MQSSIHSFQDLAVYQLARRCSLDVYTHTQTLSPALGSDVPHRLLATAYGARARIAAAWGKRRQQTALIEQLSAAQLKAAEMQTWIEAAVVAGYLSPETAQDLHDRYRQLYNALDQLMENALVEQPQPIENISDNWPATA
jgi:four helix bundle protein